MEGNKLVAHLGKKIREARQAAKMNGQELAARIGMSQSYISEIERGNRSPALSTLALIAAALNKPISYFFPESELGTENIDPTSLRSFSSMEASFPTLIRKAMDKSNMTTGELARISGISSTRLARVMRGYTPSRPLVIRLARALQADENTFLLTAGYIPKDTVHQHLLHLLADKHFQKVILKIAARFKTPESRDYLLKVLDELSEQEQQERAEA